MLKRCMATRGEAAGARAKRRSRARKEASAQEARGDYKQFAEAKHAEWKFWIDNDVLDLVYVRKFKPKNYVTGRWVLTTERSPTNRFPCVLLVMNDLFGTVERNGTSRSDQILKNSSRFERLE